LKIKKSSRSLRSKILKNKNEKISRNHRSQRLHRKRTCSIAGFSSEYRIKVFVQPFQFRREDFGFIPDLDSICDLVLTNEISQTDILFLCLPHKESQNWLNENPVSDETLIIDLGNDFRLKGDFRNRNFIYGLPEIYFNKIQSSKSIANPGCFATAIQLALLPLAKENLLKDVYTTGITGSTGAGQSLQATTHFTWRNDNISAYKTLNHQHVDEILKQINLLNNQGVELNFVPWRGDFARGIFTSSIIGCDWELEKIYSLYKDFYKDSSL
jgi:N-acetyl-gamma-glutamyl-phosphate reductase